MHSTRITQWRARALTSASLYTSVCMSVSDGVGDEHKRARGCRRLLVSQPAPFRACRQAEFVAVVSGCRAIWINVGGGSVSTLRRQCERNDCNGGGGNLARARDGRGGVERTRQ